MDYNKYFLIIICISTAMSETFPKPSRLLPEVQNLQESQFCNIILTVLLNLDINLPHCFASRKWLKSLDSKLLTNYRILGILTVLLKVTRGDAQVHSVPVS